MAADEVLTEELRKSRRESLLLSLSVISGDYEDEEEEPRKSKKKKKKKEEEKEIDAQTSSSCFRRSRRAFDKCTRNKLKPAIKIGKIRPMSVIDQT